MNLSEKLDQYSCVFIDTAPIIYFIEAHSTYGPIVQMIVKSVEYGKIKAFTSVITLAEVLPKPVELGNIKLVNYFSRFLRDPKNVVLLDISAAIAETAGRLWGKYVTLRMMDAIQIAASVEVGADAFITNDVRLKSISEINIILLNDYL